MALSDSLAFFIIFLYSTFAFGVLYASLNANLTFSDMWERVYELNMGEFDNSDFSSFQYLCFTLATLINVVLMLNLLVSTLGDTFNKFQMMSDELDMKEMLQLVIEFESIMFWVRFKQSKISNLYKLMYLQTCNIFQGRGISHKWQGNGKELWLKIDEVKDEVSNIKKNISEDLKILEENFERKFAALEGNFEKKIVAMDIKVESKMNFIMEKLEKISQKLVDN